MKLSLKPVKYLVPDCKFPSILLKSNNHILMYFSSIIHIFSSYPAFNFFIIFGRQILVIPCILSVHKKVKTNGGDTL